MAKVTEKDEELRIPTWLKVVIAGVVITIGGNAVSTRETANAAASINVTQDRQIEALVRSVGKIETGQARIEAKVEGVQENQEANSPKLDRILQLLIVKK